MKTALCFIILSLSIFVLSCKKDSFITSPDAEVTITADTLKYDTVFTSFGSVSQVFKIINENDQKLKISSIELMGGNSSFFKINADGFPGPIINNLEIAANDSIYVFASVVINQNTTNLPFVVRDSIKINYNGIERFVQLEAWGQNAHFFRNKKITANETWVNDLPYVILGPLIIDTNKILTINKGAKIYLHADAPIIVDGTLNVNGEKDSADRVYFTGDRLDEPYNNFPASWPGIFFRTGCKDNVMNYAVVKNAYQAIAVENPSVNTNPKLSLNQCIIDNAFDYGVVALNSSITAVNCLVSNCGKNVWLFKGGNYHFTHCTVVSYSNNFVLHREPVLVVSDFITVNNIPVTQPLTASFTNCIFWGENGLVDDEVIVGRQGNNFNVSFINNLWKIVQNNPAAIQGVVTSQIINNQSPVFDSINVNRNYYDFRLPLGSPAIDKGTNVGIPIDLDGKLRPVGLASDLGCYEKQ